MVRQLSWDSGGTGAIVDFPGNPSVNLGSRKLSEAHTDPILQFFCTGGFGGIHHLEYVSAAAEPKFTPDPAADSLSSADLHPNAAWRAIAPTGFMLEGYTELDTNALSATPVRRAPCDLSTASYQAKRG